MTRYIVRPRDGGGFWLTGPLLPFPLWYESDLHAITYAHHLMRSTGGKVIVLDRLGACIIAETVEPTLTAQFYTGEC